MNHWQDADCQVIGSITDLIALDRKTFEKLFKAADMGTVRALQRTDPDASYEVLVGEDVVSLWMSDQRLSVIDNPRRQP